MKKKFDENIHDLPSNRISEQAYYQQQDKEERRFLRLNTLLNENAKGCGKLLSAFYLDGLNYKVLATQMGITESSLRQKKRRCLNKFRKAW